MNHKHYQTGSVHLIILLALVIVVLGLLGWVFWHNVGQSKVSSHDATASKTDVTKATVTSDPTDDGKYLAITQWNVRFPLTAAISDAVYSVTTTDGVASANFSTTSKTKQSAECAVDATAVGGSLERAVASTVINGSTAANIYAAYQKDPTNNYPTVHIGQYYYVYQSSQAACSSDSQSDLATANDFKAQVVQLKAY